MTLVSPKEQRTDEPYDYFSLLGELSRQLNFKAELNSGLSELLVSLVDPVQRPDVILFDVEVFNTHKKISVCEILNMITTAISITNTGKMPMLAVMHSYSYNPELMFEIHNTRMNGYVVDNFVEATGALRALLAGQVVNQTPAQNKNMLKVIKNDLPYSRLTGRQRQVLKLVCNRGLSNKAIGKMLDIGESTVKIHMSAILKAYGVKNRTQLALAYKESESKDTTGV